MSELVLLSTPLSSACRDNREFSTVDTPFLLGRHISKVDNQPKPSKIKKKSLTSPPKSNWFYTWWHICNMSESIHTSNKPLITSCMGIFVCTRCWYNDCVAQGELRLCQALHIGQFGETNENGLMGFIKMSIIWPQMVQFQFCQKFLKAETPLVATVATVATQGVRQSTGKCYLRQQH